MPQSVVFRLPMACLIVCLTLLQTSRSLAQTWREVQSPHFRVVTDGSERDGRDVAKEFEQMRSVFELRFPNAALETGAPLLVVAVREPGLHALLPPASSSFARSVTVRPVVALSRRAGRCAGWGLGCTCLPSQKP